MFTPAFPVGCSLSNTMYYDPDTCSPTKTPGSIAVVGQGSTWTDDFFGTTNTVVISPAISDIRIFPTDSTVSAINADNSLVMTSKVNSETFASSPTVGGDIWVNIPIGDGSVLACWDAIDPKSYYFNVGVTLHKVTLVTPPSTFTNTVIYTYPGTAAKITTGSGAARSKDNWMVMYTIGTDQKIILINLSNPSQVFTLDFSAIVMPNFIPRAIQTGVGINVPDGLRYIFFSAGGSFSQTATDVVFTFNGSTISFDYFLPQNPDAQRLPHPSYGVPCDTFASQQGTANAFSNCYTDPHAVMAEANGVQYYVYESGISDPYFQGAVIGRLDKGQLFGTAFEAGGGSYFPYPTTISDMHFSAAQTGPYVLASEDAHNVLTAYKVTGLTIGANPMVTSSPNYSGSNGERVAFGLIPGVGGMITCIVASLSGATFTANGCTSTGTYTPGTGAFTKAIAPTPGPHMDEIDLIDMSSIASGQFKVKRLASSRDHEFTGGYQLNSYYGGSHAVISPDGSLACWQFNNNLPDNFGIACAPTGIAVPPPTLICPANSGIVGVSYSSNFSASGGTSPYSFSLISGALPLGLSLSVGTISGIPTTPQTQSFTAQVIDKNGLHSSSPCTITISSAPPPPPNPNLSCPSTTTGQTGQIFSSGFMASSGSLPYSFSITSGNLPTGLVLNSNTGGISGTPTLAGTYNFTGKVMDSNSNSATVPCSITIALPPPPPPPNIACPVTTSGIVGSPYSSSFTGSSGTPPYTFSIISGTLPVGLSLIGSLISGMPSASGNYNFTGKISDSNSLMGTVPCTISISAAPPAPQPVANLIGIYSTQNFFAGVYSTLISLVGSI